MGHHGKDNTHRRIAETYYWRGMTQDIKTYVRQCPCQSANKGLKRNVPPMKPIKPPHKVWSQIGVDLQGPFPETPRGNKYIMVCKCYLSKFFVQRPIPDKTEKTVATELFKIFCEYGFVNASINDQGREFVNKVLQYLFFVFIVCLG